MYSSSRKLENISALEGINHQVGSDDLPEVRMLRIHWGKGGLTLLEPQSRFGDKSHGIRMVCPQIGTAVLKGLTCTTPHDTLSSTVNNTILYENIKTVCVVIFTPNRSYISGQVCSLLITTAVVLGVPPVCQLGNGGCPLSYLWQWIAWHRWDQPVCQRAEYILPVAATNSANIVGSAHIIPAL